MSQRSHASAGFLWLGSAATQSHPLLRQELEAVTSSTYLAKLQSSTRRCCGKLKPQDLGHNFSPKELLLLRQKVRKESSWVISCVSCREKVFADDFNLFCLLCLRFSVLHQLTKKHSAVLQLGMLGVSRSNLLV